MTQNSDVIIIGGGVVGLSTGYFLAKQGMKVIVLEKRYLGSGASGRCGGGIREQFSTKESILLAQKSIDFFKSFSAKVGYNILFRQGGYLYLAYTEQALETLQKNVKFQNENGVHSKILTPEKIADKYPYIDTTHIYGGAFNHRDGVAFPQAAIAAFAKGLKKLNGRIYTYTAAKQIIVENSKIRGVKTDKTTFIAPKVVITAGAYTREIAKTIGISIPTRPVKHEILVTEPIRFYQKPMLVGLPSGIYFSQSLRGEIVGGIGDPNPLETFEVNSSFTFLTYFAKEITKIVPALKYIKILRQWAGLYDISPDIKPIIGASGVDNIYIACGFSGHGFMIAPMIGKLMAQIITDTRPEMDIRPFSLNRFKDKSLIVESTMIG